MGAYKSLNKALVGSSNVLKWSVCKMYNLMMPSYHQCKDLRRTKDMKCQRRSYNGNSKINLLISKIENLLNHKIFHFHFHNLVNLRISGFCLESPDHLFYGYLLLTCDEVAYTVTLSTRTHRLTFWHRMGNFIMFSVLIYSRV